MTVRRVVQTLLALAFVAGAVTAVLVLEHNSEPDPDSAARRSEVRTAASVGGQSLRVGAAVGVGHARREALQVLADWDRRRAAAYRDGDVAALRRLYVPRSDTGASDVALLHAYVERDLRVEGLRMQVLAFRVVRRGPNRLAVEVTDRVQHGMVVGATARTPLPADRPERRRVTLARGSGKGGGAWRVVEVR